MSAKLLGKTRCRQFGVVFVLIGASIHWRYEQKNFLDFHCIRDL